MPVLRFLLIALMSIGFAALAFAQSYNVSGKNKVLTSEEAEVLNQIREEAVNLENREKRALIYSQIGKYYWGTDEKRARQFFQDAVNELIKSQNEAAISFKDDQQTYKPASNLVYGYFPRHQIIDNISRFDAESAYEYFLKSRSQKLSQILFEYKNNPNFFELEENRGIYKPLSEVAKELQLKVSVVAQNPKRALKFINEDLKETITNETLFFLKELYKINPTLANQLTEKAVIKILAVKFTDSENGKLSQDKFQYNLMIAQSFLTALGNDKNRDFYPMTVSDKTLRKLTDKISLHWLEKGTGGSPVIFKLTEKFFPERTLQITEKQKSRSSQNLEYQRLYELLKSDLSVEELLNQAESFPRWKLKIYEKAVCQLAQNGDFSGAIDLLNDKFTDKSFVKNKTASIYNSFAMKEILNNNFDQAELLINKIPSENQQFQALIYLAKAVYLNDPQKNKEKSLNILDKAFSFVNKNPADNNEIRLYATILSGYMVVDRELGISLFDSFVNSINSQKINKLAIITQNFYSLNEIFQTLKKNNFRKTADLINKFDDLETRIQLKLGLFENINLDLKRLLLNFRTCQN